MRRLYDFAPVSTTNPVVARVRKFNIEIPASEFQACLNGDAPASLPRKTLSRDEKRRQLDRLIDDHLLLWSGYAQKAGQSDDIVHTMKTTESMLLRDTLVEQEVESKAHSDADYAALLRDFCRRLFDKTDVRISTNEYALVRDAARRISVAESAAIKAGNTNDELIEAIPDGLTDAQRAQTLAASRAADVRVGDLLGFWREKPLPDRPDLNQSTNLIALLRDMLADALLITEARDRGLDKSKSVREALQRNRNALIQMWPIDRLTDRANEAMKAPDIDQQLRKWYDSHLKTLYTTRDDQGREKVLDYLIDRDTVQNDYFDNLLERLRVQEIQRLRREGEVEVDEKVLTHLTVTAPATSDAPRNAIPPE
jgi:hypothetical protein